MATLHVRNVPDSLYESLRERARRSRRSINSEAIELLRSAVTDGGELSPADFLRRARDKRPRLAADAPSAVELIRADRDR